MHFVNAKKSAAIHCKEKKRVLSLLFNTALILELVEALHVVFFVTVPGYLPTLSLR